MVKMALETLLLIGILKLVDQNHHTRPEPKQKFQLELNVREAPASKPLFSQRIDWERSVRSYNPYDSPQLQIQLKTWVPFKHSICYLQMQ